MKYTEILCFLNRGLCLVPSSKTKENVGRKDFVIIKFGEFEEELGKVVRLNVEPPKNVKWQEGEIIRKATHKDLEQFRKNRRRVFSAIEQCREAIENKKLDMHLVDAFYSMDNKRLSFFFTADGRVDFRDFVKELAGIFQKRILLLQIGPRDKAKYVGGYGICGRPVCCKNFLHDLKSIPMEMARLQGISSWGGTKLGGACEKLKCCLAYEAENYEKMREGIPNEGEEIIIDGKKLKVINIDVIGGSARVLAEEESNLFSISIEELKKAKVAKPKGKKRKEKEEQKEIEEPKAENK